MVIYFSATGNTEFIAKKLSGKINDDALNLINRIRENDYSPIESSSPFIICAPVYVCEMPRFFAQYLKNVELKGNKKVYFVFTSGGYTGIAGYLAEKLIKKKGMTYMGRAEFKMPRNYLINTRYPMLSDEENIARIKLSCDKIPSVAEKILKGERLKARHITLFEKLITLPFNPVWVKHKHTADLFCSTDKCIGCGKCTKLCPFDNIDLVDGRPVWGDRCEHCMACISNCPVEAIEYGDISLNQPRYRIGKYI
ncbi:MAG: EFR1 family ferrodoxin [Lachnospiraceae bacterium]|nr:EFR1 family ferrodoxin [Lachnospiraceae bacterium]